MARARPSVLSRAAGSGGTGEEIQSQVRLQLARKSNDSSGIASPVFTKRRLVMRAL